MTRRSCYKSERARSPFFCVLFFGHVIIHNTGKVNSKLTRKAVLRMDKAKVDYILDIFKTLSTELPEQMLYRENGDSFELRTPDGIGNCLPSDMQNNGWNLIGSRIAGVV